MSALRRFAQTNAAVSVTPREKGSASGVPSPVTPVRGTPRTRIVYPPSPVTSPSRSASLPFDWEAARRRGPAPYATPQLGRRVKRTSDVGTPGKTRVVRKKSLYERITSIPSNIAFELSQFPNNVPLPTPQNSAWIIGGSMHFLHMCVRVSQIRRVPDSDLGWEDMYRDAEDDPWFDWTVPTTCVLTAVAIINTLFLFTRTKVYYLNLASDPVASPHAAFIKRPQTPSRHNSEDALPRRSIFTLLAAFLAALWRALVVSVRFLLNLSPPKMRVPNPNERDERVQQLEVWTPGELEMALFGTYSPVHALLWMATTSANWITMLAIMGLVAAQLRAMGRSYEALLKDKAIIHSEVMHEYDHKFVYPRVNPIRKDAAVMTHQSEMVNVWED